VNESARAHSITRRAFLRRATVVTAGVSAALLVGEEVWEALDRLAPRRLLVPGYDWNRWPPGIVDFRTNDGALDTFWHTLNDQGLLRA
jgi:hypothetical protein